MPFMNHQIPPPIICHYTSSAAAVKILTQSSLLLSAPSRFNDPFDLDEHLIDFGMSQASYEKWMIERYNRLSKLANNKKPTVAEVSAALRETFLKAKEHTRIVCFSETFSEPLLWSHYANKHTGIAIGFEFDYIDLLRRQCIVGKVNYSANFESLSYFNTQEKALENWLFTKSLDWKYEKEIRLAFVGNGQSIFENIIFQPGNVKEIYFGLNCLKDVENDLKNLSAYKHVTFYRIIRQHKSFNIRREICK
jgi:hypothetical protein